MQKNNYRKSWFWRYISNFVFTKFLCQHIQSSRKYIMQTVVRNIWFWWIPSLTWICCSYRQTKTKSSIPCWNCQTKNKSSIPGFQKPSLMLMTRRRWLQYSIFVIPLSAALKQRTQDKYIDSTFESKQKCTKLILFSLYIYGMI